MPRKITFFNEDNGWFLSELELKDIPPQLLTTIKEVEERTKKTVTTVRLEVERMRNNRPHNMGFEFKEDK
jgi:hypothetical protein